MISVTDGLRCYYNSNMKEKTSLELERENRILKSNWNSLREYVEELYNKEGSWAGCGARYVLDKMNKLERNDNNE